MGLMRPISVVPRQGSLAAPHQGTGSAGHRSSWGKAVFTLVYRWFRANALIVLGVQNSACVSHTYMQAATDDVLAVALVDDDFTVLEPLNRAGRARLQARRVLAVVAQYRDEVPLDLGIAAFLDVLHGVADLHGQVRGHQWFAAGIRCRRCSTMNNGERGRPKSA